LPKIIISKHKKQVFCSMNSARKRMLSWRSYSHCRNKTDKQSFYIMAAILVINVCVCTTKGHHCFLITFFYQQFLVCIYSWDSESHFLYRQSGDEQIQFPLFGKETASFIEKELLPNAYLIDYNTKKYVFSAESSAITNKYCS